MYTYIYYFLDRNEQDDESMILMRLKAYGDFRSSIYTKDCVTHVDTHVDQLNPKLKSSSIRLAKPAVLLSCCVAPLEAPSKKTFSNRTTIWPKTDISIILFL